MFKSAEKLRHEAAQRQLDRVASTWRGSRTTWFDGTPESIEARLAQTERVLTVARSGYTPAHLELTVEAENARKELLAAKHRLLTDFLDDGARAFQGSRRVAGEHSMRDRIDQAYENGGRLDRSLVGVNPGDGIYRNHPGMIDGYDEGDYQLTPGEEALGMESWEKAYDAGSDPDFVPADYLGPAGRDLGGKHRLHENDHGMWEDQLMEGGGPGAPQNGPGKHRRDAGLHTAVNLEDSLRGLAYESNEDNYDPEYGDPRFHHRHPDAECEHCGQPLYTENSGEQWTHVNNDGDPVESDHRGIPTDEYFGGPEELCHHGLSATWCADPVNHYPRDM